MSDFFFFVLAVILNLISFVANGIHVFRRISLPLRISAGVMSLISFGVMIWMIFLFDKGGILH